MTHATAIAVIICICLVVMIFHKLNNHHAVISTSQIAATNTTTETASAPTNVPGLVTVTQTPSRVTVTQPPITSDAPTQIAAPTTPTIPVVAPVQIAAPTAPTAPTVPVVTPTNPAYPTKMIQSSSGSCLQWATDGTLQNVTCDTNNPHQQWYLNGTDAMSGDGTMTLVYDGATSATHLKAQVADADSKYIANANAPWQIGMYPNQCLSINSMNNIQPMSCSYNVPAWNAVTTPVTFAPQYAKIQNSAGQCLEWDDTKSALTAGSCDSAPQWYKDIRWPGMLRLAQSDPSSSGYDLALWSGDKTNLSAFPYGIGQAMDQNARFNMPENDVWVTQADPRLCMSIDSNSNVKLNTDCNLKWSSIKS
jgi:hypothetical protein